VAEDRTAAKPSLWQRFLAYRRRVKETPLVKVTIHERRNPWTK